MLLLLRRSAYSLSHIFSRLALNIRHLSHSIPSRRRVEHLHPAPHPQLGLEERFPLSPLDFIITQNYSTWALIFKLRDAAAIPTIAQTLRHAVQATLAQCRHMVGTIEGDGQGDYTIVKKTDSTVPFVVYHLPDGPSYAGLARAGFASASLGDPARFTMPGMTMPATARPPPAPASRATSSPSSPAASPSPSTSTTSPWTSPAPTAWSTRSPRTAAPSSAAPILHPGMTPGWTARALSRREALTSPPSQRRHPPSPNRRPQAPGHPQHGCSHRPMNFHIRRPNRLPLARAPAQPRKDLHPRPLGPRHLPRVREHAPPPNTPLSERRQGNVLAGGISSTHPSPLSIAQVIAPETSTSLTTLVLFIREVTDGVTPAALNVRLDSFGPMAVAVTDWRGVGMCEADWGWGGNGGADGRPAAARQLADTVVENMVMIYPRRDADVDASAGLEVVLPFETEFLDEELMGEGAGGLQVTEG
ncbi:uncharacterized protein BDV14DRAFT_201977 [Aspergillus stella-maris]|uniref:uncharacterized protein n=1 Tax=Aspergillus stella-maris TaxID=1810926 RepID=UPI003CCD5C08